MPTMGEVDAAFIQEIEHRPKITTILLDDGIPLINLSYNHRTTDSIVAEIGNACREWGFFQVINHGVPLEKLRRVEEASKKFFRQTPEEKKKVRRDEVRVLGFYETEHTKNVRDWKEVFDIVVQNPTIMPASHEPDDAELTEWINKWPEYPPELRDVCEEYGEEMEKLSQRLMELIAQSLGLAPDRFHGFFFKKQHTSSIRLNHYPPCPAPHLALGLGRHKDAGALTILATDDVGGLEVKRKRDGEWVRVKTAPDAYIINVGDVIQVWSNDMYESVEHRVVVNSERERFSMPFRLNPGHYVMVEPLEELVNEENPKKYRAYNWGKFQATKKRSNFMKLKVENLQISHFRLS